MGRRAAKHPRLLLSNREVGSTEAGLVQFPTALVRVAEVPNEGVANQHVEAALRGRGRHALFGLGCTLRADLLGERGQP